MKTRNGVCRRLAIFCVLVRCGMSPTVAQNIPVGSWRSHDSFTSTLDVAIGQGKVYAATVNGVLVFSTSDKSLSVYNKLNGLSAGRISAIAYADADATLLVGFENGRLDIIRDNRVTVFDGLVNASIPGSRKINHIDVDASYAWLSTDFGVTVFDLDRGQIRETYRDIGPGGTAVRVSQSARLGDTVYLATASGLLAGNLDDNLLDFAVWRRYATGAAASAVAVYADSVYVGVDGQGLRVLRNGGLFSTGFLQGVAIRSLVGEDSQLDVCTATGLWSVEGNTATPVDNPLVRNPSGVRRDGSGSFWVADREHGLVSNTSGTFTSYLPNGPHFAVAERLRFGAGQINALAGGYDEARAPAGKDSLYSTFQSGTWSSVPTKFHDLTDIAFVGARTFIGSFGNGVQMIGDNGTTVWDESNSPLVNLDPPRRRVEVTALAPDGPDVWVANYGAPNALLRMSPDKTWQAFGFPEEASRYPLDLLVDAEGDVWMILDPVVGGGVLVVNPENNAHVYLNTLPDHGNLPSSLVHSVLLAADGSVWLGTERGAVYFPDPERIFSGAVNCVKPILQNRFLLESETIRAMAVDAGNRKWFGTNNGLWLIAPDGDAVIHYFTPDNSPLPSNTILGLAIDPASGEVFVSTDAGLVSYRSDATQPAQAMTSVKIFPNPVPATFNGYVGISGLVNNAVVKITDVNGKVIWQTVSNGGTAAWSVRDPTGKRAGTGVYLVFAVSEDGSQSIVGKIAVIN